MTTAPWARVRCESSRLAPERKFFGGAGALRCRLGAFHTTPDLTAHTAACVRSLTANFLRMFCTCSFTVSTLMPSAWLISSFASP